MSPALEHEFKVIDAQHQYETRLRAEARLLRLTLKKERGTLGFAESKELSELSEGYPDIAQSIPVGPGQIKHPESILVVVQDSSFYAPVDRNEKRITEAIPCNNEQFGKQWVAKLNRKADTPYRLCWADVQVTTRLEQYTDERLREEGITPLEEGA